jgi:hypothetical protein
MGVGPVIGLLIMVILMIISLISLWYFAVKKKSKIGVVLSSILLIFLLMILFTNKIDQLTYSKSDVLEDLKFTKIVLNEDFEILENKVHGMPERFQETRIKISTSDLNRLVKEIESDPEYHHSESEQILRHQWHSNLKKNSIVTASYIYCDYIVRESYYQNDDYIASHFTVRLKENDTVLEFQKIED